MIFKSKKLKSYSTHSFTHDAWQRLKKDKLAIIGLSYIILIALISIFAYIISPDNSPFANTQILEINKKKPGFQVKMLKVKKNEVPKNSSFFSGIFYGFEKDYYLIPIKNWRFDSIYIEIEHYSDYENIEGIKNKLLLPDVLYPIKDKEKIKLEKDSITFQNIYGELVKKNVSELRKMIEEKHIIKKIYLLGTDIYGRDFLSRLIIGARVSLSVGFISVIISLLVGISVGITAGYYRGKTDNILMWLINVVWSVPTLLLVIAITFALGKGFWQIFIAVGLTMWVEVARIVRGQVLSIREKEFVEAAKVLGYSDIRILFFHILPNITAPIIVISAGNFASAILLEAGLSFLGIGVQPPMPSWGSMIKEHYPYIVMDYAYLAIIPGICVALLVLSFILLGNGLRDALNVKIK